MLLASVPAAGLTSEEQLFQVDLDLEEEARWRPFRPVLRDAAARPGAAPPAGC